jgi:hypothetical protein
LSTSNSISCPTTGSVSNCSSGQTPCDLPPKSIIASSGVIEMIRPRRVPLARLSPASGCF